MSSDHAISTVATLVLTDVVDSTRLTERLGDRTMAQVWAAHDRIARDLLAHWRGREIDKSDGMLALFDRVSDGVGFARSLHGTLASSQLPVQVRAGIHCGPVMLRSNSESDVARGAKPIEVAGRALPITTRLASIAVGGQTLVTGEARKGLVGTEYRVRSHGFWRMQGIAEPLEVCEVGDVDTAFQVPSDAAKAYQVTRVRDYWEPTRQLQHSLPAERNAFVGRRYVLDALTGRLEDAGRLISIVGIGGCGKTRLATRLAWECLGRYPGGAWFCDLSQAQSLDDLVFAVARGMHVPLGKGDPLVELGEAIAGRGQCLLLVDNFEQVARYAERTVGQWSERAREAQFVITSREVLGIAGEEVFQLEPMLQHEAAQLFAQRASAARIGYAPSANDLQAIQQLVSALDGLPLAIELAAARVRIMAPGTLVARMRHRLDLVAASTGRRDRQATLRATFDWSWDLLSEQEKAALAMLSVFEGGFTLDAAGAVLAPLCADSHVIDAVQGLVDKSLLRQTVDERFDLLETVREYALSRLSAVHAFPASGPECAAATRSRHYRYFGGLSENAAVAMRGIEARNLIAACRAAIEMGDNVAAADCLVGAWAALRLIGPYRTAVGLAKSLLALPTLGDREKALGHWVAGDALEVLGDAVSAHGHLQQGLRHAESVSAGDCMARLLVTLGTRQTLDGDLEKAKSSLDRAYAGAMMLGDLHLQMRALNALGLYSDHQSRWEQARKFYEEALSLARSLRDRRMEGGLLGNLGGLYHDMGQPEAARTHYEMALSLAVELGDRRWEGNARCNLGLLHQEQGRSEEARSQFEKALAMARQVGNVRLEYTVLCNLGIGLAAEGRDLEAAPHLERAVAAAAACADVRAEGQFRGYLAVNQARRGLFQEAFDSLDAGEPLLRAISDRLSYALLLCDRAEVAMLASREPQASDALAAAEEIAAALNCQVDSELCRRVRRLRTTQHAGT